MIKNKLSKGILVGMSCLFLASCGPSEEEIAKEKKIAVEKAKKQADEEYKQKLEDIKKKQTTPYTVSELNDNVGIKYKAIKKGIVNFNNDIDRLKKEEITVYDLNENVADFTILLNDLNEVDTYKIHEDYIDFYNMLIEGGTNYITNLERFSQAYHLRDVASIEQISKDLRDSVLKIENSEEKIFATPLGNKILDSKTKQELTKRFKEACKVKIDEENKGIVDKLTLPDIDITKLDAEKVVERRKQEAKLKKERQLYYKKAQKDYDTCYQEFITERETYGSANNDKTKTKINDEVEDANTKNKKNKNKVEKNNKIKETEDTTSKDVTTEEK